ncbi:aldo/keto reductase [Actinokineospora guangxiensis]|uniref:Aldo/keto reductase n=1 Tax=Actinokineospora guangxiensis TaxID=1490288 RepID=A0ABW0EPH4_9PSEU
MPVPNVTLNDGSTIPQLGFGTWQIPDAEVGAAVGTALEAGYRAIDTAAAYQNEVGTGRAIAESGIPRADVHVTTKLWNSDQGYDTTLRAFDASLDRLGMDYVDLYLIHWPTPKRALYVDTWRAFEKLRADGRARSIGVSNFHQSHLEHLLAETDVVPAVNQIELHPNLPQSDLRAFNATHDIATQAWSPLASGGLLTNPAVAEIATRLERTPAQVILRWHLQLGAIVIPKSVTPDRIRSNFAVTDFTLSDDDITQLSTLENGKRTGPNPDTFI